MITTKINGKTYNYARTHLVVEADVYEDIRAMAKAEHESIRRFASAILRRWIRRQENKSKA